jgi:hypothetical protein
VPVAWRSAAMHKRCRADPDRWECRKGEAALRDREGRMDGNGDAISTRRTCLVSVPIARVTGDSAKRPACRTLVIKSVKQSAKVYLAPAFAALPS